MKELSLTLLKLLLVGMIFLAGQLSALQRWQLCGPMMGGIIFPWLLEK